MNTASSILTAFLTLAALLQGIVAFMELKSKTGRPKIWLTSTTVCIILAVISGCTSYASLSKSDSPSPPQSTTATQVLNTTSVPTTALQTPTPVSSTPTTAPQVETWTGAIQRDTSNWVSTYYAELHVTHIGQTASFQGNWCEDLTDQKDLYGHSVCTNSMSISGSWIAFSKLDAGLQADINHNYPNTTHDPIIIWSGQAGTGQGNLCQDCRYYASIQNKELNGLVYWATGEGPHGKFNLTIQGSGTSKLGN